MGLVERSRQDAQRYTSDLNGWASVVTFRAPTGEVATINCRFTKIYLEKEDGQGNTTDTKYSHVTFAEKLLTDLAYPLRDANGQVHMADHLVTATDSTGTELTYVVRQWQPDETVGIIVCPLADYKPDE